MKAYAKTDIGNCREENQDSYWIGELGDDAIAVSYTHLTLPTKLEV